MALVLEEVVVKDQLLQLLRQLDFNAQEEELFVALKAKGASDPHYRTLCAHLAGELASWFEFLAGNERPSPLHIPTDTPEAFAKGLVPLLHKEGAHKLATRLGLDDGDAPLQSFSQKADLLGYFLGELLACRLLGYNQSKMQNPSVSAEMAGDFGECIKTAFAVLKIDQVPATGDKAIRVVEDKIVELNRELPEDYNRPLFDLSSLSPDQLARLDQINDKFKAEYSRRQVVVIDRFHQTLIPLFRVKGVPAEIKEGLQANINEELNKYQKSHSCEFSTWDIVVARDDLIGQQVQRTNTQSAFDFKGNEPRMKKLVVNVEVYRRGSGGRVINKKEEVPKRGRRRRKWEADDASSLPTGVEIEGSGKHGDAEHEDGEEEKEGEPLPEGGRGEGEEKGDGEEELTREEREERRRLANERRERGEKKKAEELLKKKAQEPQVLSKQDKQFLKQQLKKEKRQQRREKKLEKTRRGKSTDHNDEAEGQAGED